MRKRLLFTLLFIAYCLLLIKIMVLKDLPTIRIGQMMLDFSGTNSGYGPNYVPFKTILPYLLGTRGFLIGSINLLGNIVLLVPVGILLPLVATNMSWRKTMLVAIASGLTIELMQVVLKVGIFDIDDIILNALGVIIGYWAFVLLNKWIQERQYKNIVIATVLLVATMALGLYLMIPKNQGPIVADTIQGSTTNNAAAGEKNTPKNTNDLCQGSGGTGQITSVANSSITIKRNDGSDQLVQLDDETNIRTSAGAILPADLKVGERVTIVVDDSEIASLILVCITKHPTTKTQD